MRPASIKWFSTLYLISVAFGALSSWNRVSAALSAGDEGGRVLLVAIPLVAIGVALAIWYFIVRRRSGIAAIIGGVLFALSLATWPRDFEAMRIGAMSMLAWAGFNLPRLAAFACLLAPGARAWLAGTWRDEKADATTFE